MTVRHIRCEPKTREFYKLVGNGQDLNNDPATRDRCVAWCGTNASGQWFFLGADHAFNHLSNGGIVAVCRKCLRTLQSIINNELEEIAEVRR